MVCSQNLYVHVHVSMTMLYCSFKVVEYHKPIDYNRKYFCRISRGVAYSCNKYNYESFALPHGQAALNYTIRKPSIDKMCTLSLAQSVADILQIIDHIYCIYTMCSKLGNFGS